MRNFVAKTARSFRAAAEEFGAGLFTNVKAFAHALGSDPSQTLGPVFIGLGVVTAAAALTGVLPLGIALGASMGLAAGAIASAPVHRMSPVRIKPPKGPGMR